MGFDAGLERRVYAWSNVRGAVRRDVLGDPSGLFGLFVGVRVQAADVPVHRWRVPFGAEKEPKSSLAGTGAESSSTRPWSKWFPKAVATRLVASGSLTVSG
jgi:hypothetical protein